MVAVIPQAAISTTNTRKPPRDQQDKPQPTALNNNGGQQRRPRVKNVPSRYLSPSPFHSHYHSTSSNTTTTTSLSTSSSSSSSAILKTSKRYPSPLLSRTTSSASNFSKTPSSLPKRSQSVDRRRPSAAHVTSTEMSVATKMLITSTRNLSVSFQGFSSYLDLGFWDLESDHDPLFLFSYTWKGEEKSRRENDGREKKSLEEKTMKRREKRKK